jgi:hypothetical protein
MTSVVKTAKDLFAIPKLGTKIEATRRASVFGMVESGKTTILGLLHLTCIDYANKANRPGSKDKFHFLVQERTSGIRQAASELRLGMFPQKTPADHTFEADFYMRFGRAFGEDQIVLPFCETAGETFGKLLDRFQKGQYEIKADMKDANLVHDYILDTDAVVLIAPVTRPLGLEEEKGAKLNLPDVNLSRLLASIYQYKSMDAAQNPGHRPIKGVAVFLTKYDAAQAFLETAQMNLRTEQGVHAFMSKYFPETYAVLGWYGLENVKFWPTGVEIELKPNAMGQPAAFLHPMDNSRGWKMRVNAKRNVPVYTEQPFYEFIDWLKNTVMA